jgi:hypothetical protein
VVCRQVFINIWGRLEVPESEEMQDTIDLFMKRKSALKKIQRGRAPVVYACNPSYSGGRD